MRHKKETQKQRENQIIKKSKKVVKGSERWAEGGECGTQE